MKFSAKQAGIIKAYAASTKVGNVRQCNEDRVSIILNITKPGTEHVQASFFSVYDGHEGNAYADFLRDNLHQYIIREQSFPKNPR